MTVLPVEDLAQDRGRARVDVVALTKLGVNTLQLALVVLLIRQYQIESATFFRVMILVLAGFVVHALLPMKWRLHFFVLLGFGAILLSFGFGAGFWLVGLGGLVLGVCHLPVRSGLKLGLLLLAGLVLALFRGHLLHLPVPGAVWPILGSMFMFRLAIYLYDIRHGAAPPTAARTLAYFFMLPNVSFPLFPLVDYKTFERTYYDADAYEIYQRGLKWILRGLLQLVVYRLVYYHLTIDPAEVNGMGDLLRYIFTTFLLYVRVSGQFHLIIGMLHLFGFHLPEANHKYLLSSSFTDFWRRINIYWKDAMMKLVYYPSFFRLRKRYRNLTALTIAMVIVFATTWALHSYQWFWLRGSFLLAGHDVLFWLLLGALVVFTAWREARKGSQRALTVAQKGWSFRRGLGTLVTMSTICFLWSLWSAESVRDWLGMLSAARHVELKDVFLWGGILTSYVLIAGRSWDTADLSGAKPAAAPLTLYLRSAGWQTLSLVGFLAIGFPSVRHFFGPRGGAVIASLRQNRLNDRDERLQLRGYYENLDDVDRYNTQAWHKEQSDRPEDWKLFKETPAYRTRDDFLLFDNKPGAFLPMYKGFPLTINRWGMRDRDYELEKVAGTYRIAVLGPSDVMGSGVADGEPFEAQLEDRLNQELAGRRYQRFEVLNFGVERASILQQLALLDEQALKFSPDVVVVSAHPLDLLAVGSHLLEVVQANVPIPYDYVQEIVAQAQIKPTHTSNEVLRLLHPYEAQLYRETYLRLGQRIREAGAVPVVLLLRVPGSEQRPMPETVEAATAAGFSVIDLTTGVYPEDQELAYRAAEWDRHPNREGHRLLADRLFQELRARDSLFGLGFSPVDPGSP